MNPNEDTSVDTTRYNKRLMGNVVRLPMEVTLAKGCRIFDKESDRFLLDFWGDEGVCSLGYNSPEYQEMMASFHNSEAPHQLPDVYPHAKRWEAAEIICDRTGMDRIFFANSGTEANEAMIKIARKYWWDKEGQPMKGETYLGEVSGEIRSRPSKVVAQRAQRHVILTVADNFHGRTGFSLAATDPRVSPYHRWGFGEPAPGFGVIDLMDGEFKQVVTDGRPHEPRDVEWHHVAAVTLAPILGNNLVKTYPRSFWESLNQLREAHGVLVMLDDVQAGSGRAGHYATWQHSDIADTLGRPDIMALGKGMALGLPMSAMLATEEVAQAFTPGVHFNTFGGSPLVCHAATYFYQWLDSHLATVRRNGDMLRKTLQALPWVEQVDGSGLLNAFTPRWDCYDGFQLCHAARAKGLSIVTHRQWGPIRFTPPMNVTPAEIVEAIGILDDVVKALSK